MRSTYTTAIYGCMNNELIVIVILSCGYIQVHKIRRERHPDQEADSRENIASEHKLDGRRVEAV